MDCYFMISVLQVKTPFKLKNVTNYSYVKKNNKKNTGIIFDILTKI